VAAPVLQHREDTSSLARRLREEFGLDPVRWNELDLNREAAPLTLEALRGRGVDYPQLGFQWNKGDRETELWYPQGISGLRGTFSPGGRRRFIVVSWHGKGDYDQKGVRLSFVDVTDPTRPRYRHALLVKPSGDARVFAPIKIHAGGVATRGSTLFVADTAHGVRAFDARSLFPASADPSKGRCGREGGRFYAFDYRYVLPQAAFYEMTMGGPRFSYASLDWSHRNAPHLITGNYHREPETARYHNPPASIAWWTLDGDRVTAYSGKRVETGVERAQGAVAFNGNLWLSQSGSDPHLVVRSEDGTREEVFGWPRGCEDLHYSPYSKRLWCHTEHPPDRFVFAVRLSDYAFRN